MRDNLICVDLTYFSRSREMSWVSPQSYFPWSLLRTMYEDPALVASGTCGQASLHRGEAFGAESWKLPVESFSWAGPLRKGRRQQTLRVTPAGRKEGAVRNMSIFNYLLITQETFLAYLLCAQVLSSRDACLERMSSPWDSTLTPQHPPQVWCPIPSPSILSHGGSEQKPLSE